MLKLERNTSVNLYANFLTLENKEAVDIVDPKITIKHIHSSGTTIIDINEQPMTFAIETMYYFKWTIPLTQDVGIYTVEYEAVVDGEYAEANESFEVVEFEGDEICDYTLTSADKVAAYLGVDASTIELDWIEWASHYIQDYTGISFCPKTTKEKHDIERHNESIIMLDHYPIIEILEVDNYGTIMDLNDVLLYEEEGFIKLDDYCDVGSSILNSGNFTKGRQKVHVTYKYGYTNLPKDIEWAATVLVASIGMTSLTQSGAVSVGDVIEEEIGNYRRKKSVEESGSTSFSMDIEGSKDVNDRLMEDVFSAKNVLRMYRGKGMRSV